MSKGGGVWGVTGWRRERPLEGRWLWGKGERPHAEPCWTRRLLTRGYLILKLFIFIDFFHKLQIITYYCMYVIIQYIVETKSSQVKLCFQIIIIVITTLQLKCYTQTITAWQYYMKRNLFTMSGNVKKRLNKQPLRLRYNYDTTLRSFYENIFYRTATLLSLKNLLRLATFK